MTIIVFLVDTSASMNQRAYLGGRPSLLDVAKGAVETFVKVNIWLQFFILICILWLRCICLFNVTLFLLMDKFFKTIFYE